MALDVKQINQDELSVNQYFKEDCSALKKQVVIHFTAGNTSAVNTIGGWNQNPERVGTAFVISGKDKNEKDGQIYQAFGSKYWDYHIAFSKTTNNVPAKYHDFKHETQIAKASIAVEICNWGGLTKSPDGSFRTYLNGIVHADEVVELSTPYRGFSYYHAYTDNQLSSLRDLLVYLCDKYNIPKKFNADMFDINTRALDGEAGIWTHTSFRSDKCDCSPQPKFISMLQSLNVKSL